MDNKVETKECSSSSHEEKAEEEKKPKVPKVDPEVLKLVEQRKALKVLAVSVRDIFSNHPTIMGGKSFNEKKPLPQQYAENYIKTVESANFKWAPHKKIFLEIFSAHRGEILQSDKKTSWLGDNRVEAHLGKGIAKAEKQNNLLKLSMAFVKAQAIKDKLESDASASGPNEADDIRMQFEYNLADELLSNLMRIFILAVEGDEDRHVAKLEACANVFDARRGVNEATSEEEEAAKSKAGASLGKLLPGSAGGTMSNMLSMVTEVFGGEKFLEAAGKKMEAIEKLDTGGTMNIKDVLGIMGDGIEDFQPAIEEAVEKMSGNAEKSSRNKK